MKFFYKYFGKDNHVNDSGEMFVCCPFPHYDNEGNAYYEKNPSAHINIEKSMFHCKVCGEGMSEVRFLSKLQGISYKEALLMLRELDQKKEQLGSWTEFRKNFLNSEAPQKLCQELGILEVAEELQIGYTGTGISFPVFVYGELLDIRTYNPNGKPKVRSEKNAKSLIIPFDLWMEDDRPTLLCAGEKDMAIARVFGFNSITFTGGEQAFPKLFKASFRGKKVYIIYDNDQAGQEGARKAATLLKDAGAIPYVVTGHYKVCKQQGEDLYDFFMKYGKNRYDLQKILDNTEEFTEEEYIKVRETYIPTIRIEDAGNGEYHNRFVSSNVNIVSIFEEVYQIPEYVEFEKYDLDGKKDTMQINERREWVLDETNLKDILLLMDSNLKQKQVDDNLRILAGVPLKEPFVAKYERSRIPIYKAVVTDDTEGIIESVHEDTTKVSEFLVYSVGKKLYAGKKYRITYKPVPHPLKAQQVVGIVHELEESTSSVSKFKVTDGVRESLKKFQVQEGQTVEDKMNELYERAKGFIGVEARKLITFTCDLFYHTPLQFQFANRTERAYLDIMIIGDPRTGKSNTIKKMHEMYELGSVTSLKTTTIAGLLGGSDQSGGGWKTKIGLLPRSHKSALIMEEFSGGGKELISKLTEVRSSNMVRLTRVNGSINVPAMVRMLSISNPMKMSDGTVIPLEQYNNGIQVLLDLIGATEDIARYDFFLLVPKPSGYISPLDMFTLEPFAKEDYMNRVRWVWSRKKEQVILDRPVLEYIVKVSEELNRLYDSHISLFGAETWKKLSRIAIACAGMLCSMDETGEKLIVTKEHVDWAKNFLVELYDNDLFKLREFVEYERSLNELTDIDIVNMQGIYDNHTIMLKQLEMSTDISRNQLMAVSGLDRDEFSKTINQLARYSFVQLKGEKIVPTQKFRKAIRQINKNVYLKKVGEV